MDTIKVGGVGGGGTIGEAVVARRRRSYSSEEKQRLVAESYEPGTSVALVARRHADIRSRRRCLGCCARRGRPGSRRRAVLAVGHRQVTGGPGLPRRG